MSEFSTYSFHCVRSDLKGVVEVSVRLTGAKQDEFQDGRASDISGTQSQSQRAHFMACCTSRAS